MKTDFSFFHELRVRFGECDPQKIVFNANYLLFYDVAITEYLRALGFGFSGENALEFFAVRAETNFRAPAVFDDSLTIGVRCSRLGQTSAVFDLEIYRGDTLLNDGQLVYVNAEPGTNEKARLPGRFIEKIMAFEQTRPSYK
ncbi:MAG: thioesterase family protein [Pseudomonadota bacterium]